MKILKILGLILIIFSSELYAQKVDKKINDLTFLYVEAKYDKAIAKGQSLMQNDSYSKHPLVYIYTSMSYYEMSKKPGEFSVGEKGSKYPKPLKMAQKHLTKFIKVDKKAPKIYDRNWYDDFKEYYIQIADSSNELAQYLYMSEEFRKSASVYKLAYRAVPSDPVLQLWQGIGEMKSKNTAEGKKSLAAALKVIDENFVPSRATSSVLAKGMVLAEEILRGKEDYENADKAKRLVDVFKKYDPVEKKKTEKKKESRVINRSFISKGDSLRRKGTVVIKTKKSSVSAEDELDRLEKEALERK